MNLKKYPIAKIFEQLEVIGVLGALKHKVVAEGITQAKITRDA